VDVQELMAVLLFDAPPLEVLVPEPEAAGASSFKTPAREFELGFVELTKSRPFTSPAGRGVEILLQLEGASRLESQGSVVTLKRGCSVLVPAAVPSYVLQGEGRIARARVPA
jgi:mannose-6-phosphate isomerase class I